MAVVVLLAVATAPAAAVAAHLKVERRDLLFDGVPQGAVSFGESVMSVFCGVGVMRGYLWPLVHTRR